MSRLRLLLLLSGAVLLALIVWGYVRNTRPPEVAFARVVRERLVSTLVTNGKVEPSRWAPVRAERPGIVATVAVERGQRVAEGALIATLESREQQAVVQQAQAALAQAQAEAATIKAGGTGSARVEIENALARARTDLQNAERDLEVLRRLEQKQAATRQQVTEAERRVNDLRAEVDALERKRTALVGAPERAASQARIQEAEARLAQARAQLEASRLLSPMAGAVYDLNVRPGAYVDPAGPPAASVGVLDTVRVRVYVDEPELGRVATGQPVTITWDALPGRDWKGAVETKPTEIVALGTRQVGEVVCTIANPDRDLLPGTNVNATIQTNLVENALTIPKEAVRRSASNDVGVYVKNGDRIHWRSVRLGPSSITRTAVAQGLSESDQVAVTTDRPLIDGERVTPLLR